MKQKNLILMVVAVGCGLVAAFLTAQMNAKPAAAEQYDVLVAVKDLPVSTTFTKDELKTMVKWKKMPKDALPPAYVTSEADLLEKRLTRPVRAEELFNPLDLTKGGVITLPQGMDLVSLQVNIEQAVSGFVTPGSRVDILASAKSGDTILAFPLLVNMLVIACDRVTTIPQGDGTFATINTVSMAVDRKQALLIHLAKQRSCMLSLVLRHPDEKRPVENWSPEDVEKLLKDGINAGGRGKTKSGDGEPRIKDGDPAPEKSEEPKKVETVKVHVATEDIAANTMITEDLIKEKFKQVDLPAPAPANAVTDLAAHLNKHLLNAVAADQWVSKKHIGTPDPKPEPRDGVTEATKPAPSVVEPVKPVEVLPVKERKFHDVVVQSTNGTRTFRYEVLDSGHKYLGEVFKDQPKAEATEAPKAEAPKAETPKADESPKAVRPQID